MGNPFLPTRCTGIQVIKGFRCWATNEELIDEKQARRIKLPKMEQKMIQVFSPACACMIASG
jgi:hypothetical protein